jgi:hypothetical protein
MNPIFALAWHFKRTPYVKKKAPISTNQQKNELYNK